MTAVKSAQKTEYYQWLMLPKGQRVPATQKEMCIKLGVAKPTLNDWERQLLVSKEEQDNQRMVAIEDMLYDQATTKGVVKAAELYARIKGKLVEKTETKVSLELSADQLDKVRRSAEERVRGETARLNGRTVSLPAESPVLLQ
jgi:hypothetical protein